MICTSNDNVRLIQSDCLQVREELVSLPIAAVVTDPPYGIGCQLGDCGKGVHAGRNVNMMVVGDDRPFDPTPWLAWPCLFWGAHYCAARLPSGGSWLVWDKRDGMRGPDDSFSDADLAWCSRSGIKRNIFHYLWKGVACAKEGEDNGRRWHPMQKPVALMRWCLSLLELKPGSIILDPYMGSGSTGVAALQLGLCFIGIEVDAATFRVAESRIGDALIRRERPHVVLPGRNRKQQFAPLLDLIECDRDEG